MSGRYPPNDDRPHSARSIARTDSSAADALAAVARIKVDQEAARRANRDREIYQQVFDAVNRLAEAGKIDDHNEWLRTRAELLEQEAAVWYRAGEADGVPGWASYAANALACQCRLDAAGLRRQLARRTGNE